MYNKLFESIIRTSGENTDDTDDFADRDNFWAPAPVIEQMFEQILREGILSIKSKDDNTIVREPKSGLPYLKHYANKIIDVFDRLLKNDKTVLKDDYILTQNLQNFYVADIAPVNNKVNKKRTGFNINGDFFVINYKMLKYHYNKDAGHKYSSDILKELCYKITDPFLISIHLDKKTNKTYYSFYLKMKINQEWTLTGSTISSPSIITTIYGWEQLTKNGYPRSIHNVEYIDWDCLKNDKTKMHFENLIDWNTSKNANKKP